jgi:hypothetical protein
MEMAMAGWQSGPILCCADILAGRSWLSPVGYPGVHRFAAGAAKTGVYVNPNNEFIKTCILFQMVMANQSYLNNSLSLICCKSANIAWQHYPKGLQHMP